MKTIIQTLLRYKSATLLNIIGLSTAFAAFILISTQIRYDMTYDKHNENYESIYMLSSRDTTAGRTSHHYLRNDAIDFKSAVSEIEYASIYGYRRIDRITLVGGGSSENRDVVQAISTCEEDLPKIFTFEWLEGDENALANRDNMVVSDEFSKRWYGDKSPIGESIIHNGNVYSITAVYKTFPENSTLKGDVYCNIGLENWNNRGNVNYLIYIKSHDNAPKEVIDEKIFDTIVGDGVAANFTFVPNAIPLSEVRYDFDGYNRYITLLMLSIAIAVIVLASINFVNFATSMVPLKIKGINMRKVVGASQVQLRATMIGESITLALISFIIALGLVELFKISDLNYILHNSSFSANIVVYIITFGVAFFAGLISSLYPTFYSTSFQPALVLKSSYALSASGRKFRKFLIGFQFFVTLSFISIALFIDLQHSYMMNRDGGYIKDGIIHVSHGGRYNKHDMLKTELLLNSQINDVAFSLTSFGTETFSMGWNRPSSKGPVYMRSMPVSYNFLDFFGIEVLEGRNFIESDEQSENGCFIMSKMFMDKYEIPIEEEISGHREPTSIVGVCDNVSLTNLKIQLDPFTFYIFGKHPWGDLPHAYIKVSGNSEQIVEYIRRSYQKTDPDVIIEINYLTDELAIAYSEESELKNIMQMLSLIAVIIALVGVFGLVSFDTRYRRKEISLRRINGATIGDILKMFSASYIKILLISFVLSVPVVYYVIDKWLVNFPYRIEVYWWVFALALLMVIILTIAVSFTQTLRSASENPINALKNN